MFTIIGGDGREYGPVSPEQIRQWMAAGRVNEQTRAKAFGTDEWKTVGEWSELAPAPAEPPPLAGFVQPDGTILAGFPLAARGRRFVAWMVDYLLFTLCCAPVLAIVPMQTLMTAAQNQDPTPLTSIPGMVSRAAFMTLALMVFAGVQVVLLALRGQTVGKWLLSIRIVQFPNGQRAGLVKTVLLRFFVMNLIEAIPYVGFLILLADFCFLFRPDRRCLHDHLAGTMVVAAA